MINEKKREKYLLFSTLRSLQFIKRRYAHYVVFGRQHQSQISDAKPRQAVGMRGGLGKDDRL